ncbi:MAG: ribose transport system substrate-binding protein [Blastocatellia bacterium]|jgi:ribose transport system substrate-binding protein|nr:ribose transport system substrate-binding protein [Blastocatellia bacterium]MDX6304891.1 ribose transport system substrate-binding protein [Blastocatellia bacterium]
MKKIIGLLIILTALLFSFSCSKTGQQSGKKFTIAVIPKGTTHEFWKSIHAGADKAASEYTAQGTNVEIIWKGPLREDEREGQIQVVEGFISQGISGIVLAPLDDRALTRPVEEAKRANIPTVIIDSGLQSDQIVSFVATDNLKGGTLAADRLGELMSGKGKILMLRYQEGSASTEQREAGFMQEMKAKFPGIEVVSSNQFAGPTRDTAKAASENLLNRFGNDIQGIFTPNESSTTGMLLALQDMKLAGKVMFVGFDSSPSFVEAMRNKQMHGTVLQSPFNMGYLGVKTMVDSLLGKPVEKRIDTGVALVTPDNLDDPKIRELLQPPVK